MSRKAWLAAAALLGAGTAQAACYSVYKPDGTLVFESSTTPVNLAEPLGDTVPAKFGPGASMTISDLGHYCKERRNGSAGNKMPAPDEAKTGEAVAAKKLAAAEPEAAKAATR